MDYRSSAARLLRHCGSKAECRSGSLILPLVGAWAKALDLEAALRVARSAAADKCEALILAGRTFGFRETGLLDEVLALIQADPAQRDRALWKLFPALVRWNETESALDVLRMMHDSYSRCSAVVECESPEVLTTELVGEAFRAWSGIEDAEDRAAMADEMVRRLVAIGRVDDALQLLSSSEDKFHWLCRKVGLAQGLLQRADPDAAMVHSMEAVNEFGEGPFGGFTDAVLADAALLLARLGAVENAIDILRNLERRGYIGWQRQQVCRLLIADGCEEQALALIPSISEDDVAVAAIIELADRRVRSGRAAEAMALLAEVATPLLAILEEAAATRLSNQDRSVYVSDLNSVEYRSGVALNQIGRAYWRIGRVDLSLPIVLRELPQGSDPNLVSLQAKDSRELALDGLRTGHKAEARYILDYGLSHAAAISHWKPYERASILASLIAPNLLVGRPAVAMDIWAKLREP